MPNPDGNVAALIPAPAGNIRGWKHGAYSERFLSPRVAEMVDELMAMPHVLDIDRASAEEIARLRANVERIDAALEEDGRVEGRGGKPRALLEVRRRYSAQLESWYAQFGMTPRARFDFAARMSFGERVEERVRQIRAEREERERGR